MNTRSPGTELVPVAPAAHYMMGGIVTDLDAASTVPGLYAVGEASCTGLHGANRLASNSLSECFVFARRAVAAALSPRPPPHGRARPKSRRWPPRRAPAEHLPRDTDGGVAGGRISRTKEGLEQLAGNPHPLARLIARCALARTESRGAHLRSDQPADRPRVRPAARGDLERQGTRLADLALRPRQVPLGAVAREPGGPPARGQFVICALGPPAEPENLGRLGFISILFVAGRVRRR